MHGTADRGMMSKILRQTVRLWIQIDYKGATCREFICGDNPRKNNDAPLLNYWRIHEEWYLCEDLNLSGDTALFWRKWCYNLLKMKLLEYSDRPANPSFIPTRLHSKVCDISLTWRTEYGDAHNNLFIHRHHSSFFWRVIKRIANWKD